MHPSQAPGDDYPEIARELRSPKRAIGWLTLSRAATAPVINDSYTFIQSTLLSDGKRAPKPGESQVIRNRDCPSRAMSIPRIAFMLAWCR